MCANCKKYGPGSLTNPVVIDWSRIPEGLDDVREVSSGSWFAGCAFRVRPRGGKMCTYEPRAHTSPGDYMRGRVIARRPPLFNSYLIEAPGVTDQVVYDVTKVQLQDHLAKAGYGPQIKVYELQLVAEAKQVEIKTVETQLTWSK